MEKDLAKVIDTYLKLKYKDSIWFLNTYGNAVQRAGVPDRLICYKGFFIGIEIKRPDGTGIESERQKIEGKRIKLAGGIYAVVESLEEVKDIMNKIEYL